jgi:hypothetical protein
MEEAHIVTGDFVDPKTIRLSEAYPYSEKKVRLIIIPQYPTGKKRKAGLLKGKIKMSDDFDAPLEDMKEYME